VINAGVPGDNSSEMNARFDADVLAHLPAAASIMVGTNYSAPEIYEADVRSMIARAKARGIRVTLCTPPVSREAVTKDLLPALVNVARQIAADTPDVPLFDVFQLFSGYTSAELDLRLYPDGNHVTALGYQSIRDYALLPMNAAAFTPAR
jgi:acyl-CoA thioesterase I